MSTLQWSDVVADKSLANLPYKIELSSAGKIEMTPTFFPHGRMAARLIAALSRALPAGEAAPKIAIQTSLGVRVPEVCWYSNDFLARHGKDNTLTEAPEICVEIVSASNSEAKMRAKVQAYVGAGAKEVWWVELDGSIRFFNEAGEVAASAMCPGVKLAPVN